MKLKIKPYYLFPFIMAFIAFTVIGTISHEYGHIAVAKYLGYETTLHYGSMNWKGNSACEDVKTDRLLISMGGPLQTILTGLIGLAILFIRKRAIQQFGLKPVDWLAIFLSLFWLREVFNLTTYLFSGMFKGNGKYFGGDEAVISTMLELPVGTVSIVLGVLGMIVSLFIVFRIVPYRKRLAFICGGLIGGISGFVLWMQVVGPVVLP